MSYDFGGAGRSNARTKRRCASGVTALVILSVATTLIAPTAVEAQDMPSITVVVDAVPDDDQDFEFTTSGGPLPASFLLDDDENFAGSPDPGTLQISWTSGLVPAGATYSIAQTPVAGWVLTSATCDNGDAPGSITPSPGNNVTCTFVNVAEPGVITVTEPVPGMRFRPGSLAGGSIHRHYATVLGRQAGFVSRYQIARQRDSSAQAGGVRCREHEECDRAVRVGIQPHRLADNEARAAARRRLHGVRRQVRPCRSATGGQFDARTVDAVTGV